MEVFEFDGAKYALASRHQKEWGGRLLAKLNLRGDEQVLDLGCGDGALTAQLAKMLPSGSVLGVDSSRGMLKAAAVHSLPNLSFALLNINELNYEQQFDVIYSNAALHWVMNHQLLLKNVYRALKPGGRIYWNFAGAGTITNFKAVMLEKMRQPEYAQYFSDFVWPWYMPAKSDYEKMGEGIGFAVFQVTDEVADRYFADADEMIKWLEQPSLVPFKQHIANELVWQKFRTAVIDSMLQRTQQGDGRCLETFRRLNVFAQK